MITKGFTFGYSDVAVNDQYFYQGVGPTLSLIATCLVVGTAGDLVWENSNGEAQWFPSVPLGYNYLSAGRVLSSATVRGVTRTTTASNIVWGASGTY